MKLWTVWVQGDDATWLEAAWEDEQTAENPAGWRAEVDRVNKLAFDNDYETRIIALQLDGAAVYEAFEIPTIKATVPDE